MAISFRSQGTTPTTTAASITGTTSVTPALPASLVNGDLVLIFVMNKPETATPSTPTDWTLVGTSAGGEGAAGNDTGPTRVTCFSRIKTSTWSTMPAITITSGTSAMTQAIAYQNATGLWDVASTGGADTTSDTSYGWTGAANPGIAGGDWCVVGVAGKSDAPTWSSQTMGATGISMGTATERSEPKTTQGGDLGGYISDHVVNSGTASAAPVVSATPSAAASGAGLLVRIRETTSSTPITGSDTASITITDSAAVVPSGGGGSGEITVVDTSSTFNNTASLTHTCPVPSGTQSGNLLVWTVVNQNAGAITTPSGWTLIVTAEMTALAMIVMYRWATGSEPADYTMDTPSGRTASRMTAFGGVDATTPIDVTAPTPIEGSGTAIIMPEITTTTANAWVVGVANGAQASGGTIVIDSHNSDSIIGQAATNHATGTNVTTAAIAETMVSPGAFTPVVNTTPSTTTRAIGAVFALRPAEASGSVSKTGSDTASLTITDTASIFIAQSGTDTASLTITDTAAIANTVPGSDATSLSISDSSAILNTMTRTDTASLTITESNALDAGSQRTDTAALTITDTAAILVTTTANDTAALTISDSGTIVNSISASDTSALTISDAATLTKNLPGTDTAAVTITDTSTLNKFSTVTDSATISIAETATVLVTLSASDTAALTITESGGSISNPVSASDTAALTITESASFSNTVTAADTASVTVTEGRNVDTATPLSDSVAITITEQASIFATTVSSDTSAVTITDTSAVGIVALKTASDTASISIADSSEVDKGLGGSDTGALTITDSGSVAKFSTGTDTAALAVSESVAIQVSVSASDTAALSISDTAAVFGTMTRTDTAALTITETTSVTLNKTGTDSASLTITDSGSVVTAEADLINVYTDGNWEVGEMWQYIDSTWTKISFHVYEGGEWAV